MLSAQGFGKTRPLMPKGMITAKLQYSKGPITVLNDHEAPRPSLMKLKTS
jgi:hypothetical protein